MYNSRGVVLKAFKRIKLTVNEGITRSSVTHGPSEPSISNYTRNTVRIQGFYVVPNLEFPCNPRNGNRVMRSGEGERDLLWLEALSGGLKQRIRVWQVHGVSSEGLVKRNGDRLEGSIQSGWDGNLIVTIVSI